MVATAVAGALGGLSASNLGAAAGGAMAPYLANAIKKATTTYDAQGNPHTDVLANTMAHAVAGAVLAQIAGGSAAAGAAGAAGGELAAKAIVKVMYPDTDIRDLTESQKQTVSALSQMAAGLAGGIASDSALGGGTGAGASKDAVENNLFGGTEDGQVNFAQEHGKNILSCSTDPDSASCQKGLAMQNALMVALPAGLGGGLLAAATPEIATAARVALQTCKGAFAICLNNIGIQVSETVVPGGVGAGGAIGIGKTVAEATTAKAEAVAANAAHNATYYAGLKMDLKTTQAANEIVDSLRNTGRLPSNYVIKQTAEDNGWCAGKALNNYVPGGQIGGDVFNNTTGILPSSVGRTWYEADIGINNVMSRAKQGGTRLLYSDDGLLYITTDHYETVTSIGKWK
ncbi:MAG: ribonuclease domain-containing protein [Pantoea sp.]|uniref:VENN motif pre-toxin domain-containing protein n=1 Tax=Pantoea sp. TaxID=69393 RepID=UPI002906000C|nr:VENN motif pre-toxin domain-containing protein [Pantoea sp.]MDU7839454.1 ribonuclease domain-containing protein [Pantoea sp.]